MKNPPHPGLAVRYDCLAPLGLGVSAGAEPPGVQQSGVRQGLHFAGNGHSSCKGFGSTPKIWLRMQLEPKIRAGRHCESEIIVARVTPPLDTRTEPLNERRKNTLFV